MIHQSTRYPAIEFAELRRAERETGGRSDMSRMELRRREYEIARADLIHVTTLAVRDEFLEAGIPAERLVHAYLGVDLARFKPTAKGDHLRIAFVGPLSMRKGVDTVAELAARIGDAATVLTVGGPTCPWSRRIVEEASFEPRGSVEEMFAEAHLLVLPSRSDAFAYVVPEALSAGIVPIVSPQVGASEVVRRLDPRLVVDRECFVDVVIDLLPKLDLLDLSRRAIALAREFDRDEANSRAAHAVVERAERLRAAGDV